MSLTNHVILCGLGELGFRTLERLRAFGDEVVVLDPGPKPEFQLLLAEWKVTLVIGSGREPRALREAGALTARALIAVSGDDMTNLAIVLAAREENPDVRLVVRLFNPRLAQKVAREVSHCRILDVAALAAPIFAYAGTHQDILHCLDVPGGRFLLRQWRGQLPPDTLPLAVKRDKSGVIQAGEGGMNFSLTAHPEWDTLPVDPASIGEKDVSFGLIRADEEGSPRQERDEYVGDGSHRRAGGKTDETLGGRRRTSMRSRIRSLRARGVAIAQLPLTPVMIILLLLTAVSVEVFRAPLGLGTVQSLYYVVTILTTTGFGDISVKDAGSAMMLYVVGLMLIGSVLMAILYAFITEALLAVRLGMFFKRQTLPTRGHFIVCGVGTVGFRILEELHRQGHSCVAIERQDNSRLQERARRIGVPVVVTADLYAAMTDVHVEEARCVLAVTDDDAVNLELALLVQECNPQAAVVVRLFERHMATLLERAFGINLARSPSAIAAPAFAVAASGDDLLDAFDLGELLWCVGQISLGPGHPLIGHLPEDLAKQEILAMTWRTGDSAWTSPLPADRLLAAGDQLVVVTPHDQWLRLQHHGSLSRRPAATGNLLVPEPPTAN